MHCTSPIHMLSGLLICVALLSGCATFVPNDLSQQFSQSVGSIHFESGSARIAAQTFPYLDELSGLLVANEEIKIRIEGHTDNVGDDGSNLRLSEQRAEAVRDYLIERSVSSGRIEYEGFGEDQPTATNDTAEGRALNRRIEIMVQKKWWQIW